MGTPGLAWHQGRTRAALLPGCLPAAGYFDLSRKAYEAVTRPAVFRQDHGRIPPTCLCRGKRHFPEANADDGAWMAFTSRKERLTTSRGPLCWPFQNG